ncbi:hypothetical protein ACJX0J_014734, partial [Zea mays]
NLRSARGSPSVVCPSQPRSCNPDLALGLVESSPTFLAIQTTPSALEVPVYLVFGSCAVAGANGAAPGRREKQLSAGKQYRPSSVEHPNPTHPPRRLGDGRLRRCRCTLHRLHIQKTLLGAHADGASDYSRLGAGVSLAHLLLLAETAGVVQSKAEGNADPGLAEAGSPGDRRFACVQRRYSSRFCSSCDCDCDCDCNH